MSEEKEIKKGEIKFPKKNSEERKRESSYSILLDS